MQFDLGRGSLFEALGFFFPNQLFWIIFWKLNRSEMIEILGDAIQYIV